MAISKFKVKLLDIKDISSNIKHFVFAKSDDSYLDFIAGQFLTFIFPNDDGKPYRRSYSIASMQFLEKNLEIAVSHVEGGVASDIFFNAKVNDEFDVMGPAGRLILKDDDVNRIFLVGTGTGIAPYRAMIEEIEKRTNISFEILLGVQKRLDALYSEDFRKYANKFSNLKFTSCLSRESKNLQEDEYSGYVQSYLFDKNLCNKKDIVYLCGNPNMIDDTYTKLQELGFDSKSVRREKYISSN